MFANIIFATCSFFSAVTFILFDVELIGANMNIKEIAVTSTIMPWLTGLLQDYTLGAGHKFFYSPSYNSCPAWQVGDLCGEKYFLADRRASCKNCYFNKSEEPV